MKYLRKNIIIFWAIVISFMIGISISPLSARYINTSIANAEDCEIAGEWGPITLRTLYKTPVHKALNTAQQVTAYSTFYNAFCK